MNKTTINVTAALSGLLLLASGAAIGVTLRPALQTSAETTTNPVPCNLLRVWDRSEQSFRAVYEDSTMSSYTPAYGLIANLSCTDAEILAWQEQRAVDGLDLAVCRPVVQFDGMDTARPIGCARPIMVVTGEPR